MANRNSIQAMEMDPTANARAPWMAEPMNTLVSKAKMPSTMWPANMLP